MKPDTAWRKFTGLDARNPAVLIDVMGDVYRIRRSDALASMWRLLAHGELKLTAERWIKREGA